MKEFTSFESLSYEIANRTAMLPQSFHHAVDALGEAIKDSAQKKLGVYQEAEGPFAAWSPLAEATMDEREALGYPRDQPLLRTGELRDSVVKETDGNTTVVGVPVGKLGTVAVAQEFGTDRIPARSFLGGTAFAYIGTAQKVLGHVTVNTFMREGISYNIQDVRELISDAAAAPTE